METDIVTNCIGINILRKNFHNILLPNRFKDGAVSYGGTDGPAKGRRVIFCVHGNPSTGCCAVIETNSDGEITEQRNGISVADAER